MRQLRLLFWIGASAVSLLVATSATTAFRVGFSRLNAGDQLREADSFIEAIAVQQMRQQGMS